MLLLRTYVSDGIKTGMCGRPTRFFKIFIAIVKSTDVNLGEPGGTQNNLLSDRLEFVICKISGTNMFSKDATRCEKCPEEEEGFHVIFRRFFPPRRSSVFRRRNKKSIFPGEDEKSRRLFDAFFKTHLRASTPTPPGRAPRTVGRLIARRKKGTRKFTCEFYVRNRLDKLNWRQQRD